LRRSANSLLNTVVASPTITSFSPDTNVIGDGITDASVLTIGGTAVANSTVNIYDGSTLVGTALANSTGLWTFETAMLADGVHSFTATDTVSGATSAASSAQAITVDTVAPAAPVIVSESDTGINQVAFSGTAEANSKIAVYDGTVLLGTTTTNGSGAWSLTSGTLPSGSQTFTATATDLAGNVSVASHPVTETIVGQTSTTAAIAAPTEAALQNYNYLAFDDEFNSTGTIDMSNSHAAGYNWYLQTWFSSGATDPNNVTISNGVLKLGGGTGEASLVSAFANSSGGYTGSVFGDGAYMEASIKFDPSGGSGASGWPAFWGLAIQKIIDPGATGASQMAGQDPGYTHYAEVDFMEYMNGVGLSNQYLGTIHDWSGTYTTTSGWEYNIANYGNDYINVGSIDWTAYHTYGLLWVPQSGSTPGHATWYFDGHAMSTVYWLAPTTTTMSTDLSGISTGSFTPSTSSQATSTYSILDSEQLALSLQTDSNWPMYVDWVKVWQAGAASAAVVAAPVIAPLSSVMKSGTVTLHGTAEANSVELVYDGANWLGSANADVNGAWTFVANVADGSHSFTATATDATGVTSAASSAVAVMVDTVAPAVTERLVHDTGSSSTDKITSNAALSGTGDPNAVVHFTVDGKAIATTVTADATGAWSFTPTGLANGAHTVVATETDAAGNTGSSSLGFTLDTVAPTVSIGNETFNSGKVALTGTAAEAGDTISIYDGATLLGTTASGSGGAWTFNTGTVSNTIHTFTVTATDTAGNVGSGSNDAILGTTGSDVLVGTSGNDIINGNGGNDTFIGGGGADTLFAGNGNDIFVFKAATDSAPALPDTIVNFDHVHDIIQFSGISGINATNGLAAFQGQLKSSGNVSLNAHSVAYIETGGNTEVFVNTSSVAETINNHDSHAPNMMIVLAGTHLGLTSSDFHLA